LIFDLFQNYTSVVLQAGIYHQRVEHKLCDNHAEPWRDIGRQLGHYSNTLFTQRLRIFR
jgi:hypothetical protein